MKKPSISVPKLNINRKFLYIGAGSLLVAGLFTFAVVSQVRAERLQKAEDSRKSQAVANTISDLKDELQASKERTATAETQRAAVCDWVRSVATDKTRRLSVPPLCVK